MPNSSAFSWNSENSSYSTGAISDSSPSRVANLLQERHHRVVEQIVAITGDHVAGAGNIGESGVRHELQELLRTFLAQEITHAAPHEQHRDRELVGGDAEPFGVDERGTGLVLRPELAADEPRVPMPGPSTV